MHLCIISKVVLYKFSNTKPGKDFVNIVVLVALKPSYDFGSIKENVSVSLVKPMVLECDHYDSLPY